MSLFHRCYLCNRVAFTTRALKDGAILKLCPHHLPLSDTEVWEAYRGLQEGRPCA